MHLFETLAGIKSAFASGTPDLLIMEVRLPDGNGMHLCRELKSQERFSVPILMMSTDWNVYNRGWPREGYLAKPFNLYALVEKIAGILEQAC